MNRISDLTRRLWAALLALCLVLALTLPVFAEGESETADTAEKETFHIGTVDDLMQLADSCRLDSWSKNRTVYLDADLELTGSGFAGIPSFSGVSHMAFPVSPWNRARPQRGSPIFLPSMNRLCPFSSSAR